MAKKKVEETVETMDFTIDDTVQEMPMQEIPVRQTPQQERVEVRNEKAYREPVNCLRNEKVIVRFIPKQTSITDPRHVLYGGMAESATRSFVVPRLSSTGQYKDVLTKDEKEFLENVMGLEYNALSIYKKNDNFWDDSNPNGIGRVILHKQDNYLDLSNPTDYIKYKILLANSDQIAASLQTLEDRPKATYQFVIISENAEASHNLSKADTTMKCYMEYGKVENDFDTLRVLIELIEGRPISARVKIDFLKGKVIELISRNPRLFLATIQDSLLPAKVLIKRCVEAGLIARRNDVYYLRDGDMALCELGEDSTLNNAAKYISSIKHQELKYSLEAKLKV